MLAFPLAFALIPYGIVVLFFVIFSLINITHLIRYGATTMVSYVMTMMFLVGSVLIFYGTWLILLGVDWQLPVAVSLPGLS